MCTPAIYFKHLFAFCSFSSHVYPCQHKPLEKKNIMSFPGGLFGVLSSVPTTSVIAHHPTVNVFTSLVLTHHQTVTRRANVYILLLAQELHCQAKSYRGGARANESEGERGRANESERERETKRERNNKKEGEIDRQIDG